MCNGLDVNKNVRSIGARSREAAALPPRIFFAPLLDHLCPPWRLDLIINL